MPSFSKKSRNRLYTCHKDLGRLFSEVVKDFDCKILEGRRGRERQECLFKEGKSKLLFPQSKHNAVKPLLSEAVDVIPYPVDWSFEGDLYRASNTAFTRGTMFRIEKDWQERERVLHNIQRWFMFIGYVKATARQIGIEIRCGADWDGDHQMSDQRFDDLPHFELV